MKIVAISDTHMKHSQIKLPDGDVLVHAGDALNGGDISELHIFLAWLQSRPHKHKIYVAGNHDICLESYPDQCRKLIEDAGIILLIDQEVTIDGVKFYGSPWTPEFFNWAFMKERGIDLSNVWDKIPNDTDVLITHGPPHGLLDLVEMYGSPNMGQNVGCEELRKAVDGLKLKKHFFGHIHSGHGTIYSKNTEFYNVAICNDRYRPVNEPIVVDL